MRQHDGLCLTPLMIVSGIFRSHSWPLNERLPSNCNGSEWSSSGSGPIEAHLTNRHFTKRQPRSRFEEIFIEPKKKNILADKTPPQKNKRKLKNGLSLAVGKSETICGLAYRSQGGER